jgi:hypothetical protein
MTSLAMSQGNRSTHPRPVYDFEVSLVSPLPDRMTLRAQEMPICATNVCAANRE